MNADQYSLAEAGRYAGEYIEYGQALAGAKPEKYPFRPTSQPRLYQKAQSHPDLSWCYYDFYRR